jgi:hypothetical protein
LGREALEWRASRVTQSQQVRDLVERLTSSIIQSLPEETVFPPGWNVEQHRVASAHKQPDERGLKLRIFQSGGKEVALKMIHPEQRPVTAECECLAVHHPDKKSPDQARSGGDRDPINLIQADTSISQRALDHWPYSLDVGSAGELRYHATKYPVHIL